MTSKIFHLASCDRPSHRALEQVAARELTGRTHFKVYSFENEILQKEMLKRVERFGGSQPWRTKQLFYVFVVKNVCVIKLVSHAKERRGNSLKYRITTINVLSLPRM